MKRLLAIGIAILAVILSVSTVMALYTATITVTESSGNSYTRVGLGATVNNSQLATNGYMLASGLDVQVLDSGTAVPSMIVSDRTMFATSITASTSKSLSYTMGNSPASVMQIISGYGGYFTTADNAALEPSNVFSLNVKGTFDVSGNVASTPIESKNGVTSAAATDALRIQAAEAGTIVAEHYGTVTTDQSNTPAAGGSYQLWGANWLAQTFTTGAAYRISSAEVSVSGITGNPGPLTLSIYNAAGNLPTGSPLSTVTMQQSTIGGGYNLFYLPPIALANATQYAFVLKAPSSTVVGDRYNIGLEGASGYAGGRECTSADSGGTWAGVANDLLFRIKYATDLVATGVTAANHLITVTQAAGPTFQLYVDSVLKDSQAYGTAVPNNANAWTWQGQHYYDYVKLNVGVPEVLRYEPNTIIIGTALPDRDGTQNGVFTFGSNPSGVTVTMGSTFTPSGSAAVVSPGTNGAPGYVGNSPGQNLMQYTSGTTGLNPDGTDNLIGAGLVQGIAQQLSEPNSANPTYVPPTVTSQWMWRVIFGVIDLAALVLAARFGSILVMGGAGLGLLYWQCSIGVYDWWTLIVFIIFAATFWTMQRASA